MAKNATVESFKTDVIDSPIPVLVDFYADWCGPCRMLGPSLEQIETQYNGKFTLVKVNVDEQAPLAMEYGISSIPAVKLFVKGKIVGEVVGVNLPDIRVMLSEYAL
ncbi:MAG: thioredoxin [Clostridiales bacterium]|jgi:thioredoxin|nr:thioredoxin [Clostridiales bacterium]